MDRNLLTVLSARAGGIAPPNPNTPPVKMTIISVGDATI